MATSDGSIVFSTKLDNTDLDKAVDKAKTKIDSLREKLEDQNAEKTFVEAEMERAQAALDRMAEKMRPAAEEFSKMFFESMDNPDVVDDDAWVAKYTQLAHSLHEMGDEYTEQEGALAKLNTRHEKINEQIQLTTEKLDRAKSKYAELSAEQQKSSDLSKRTKAIQVFQDKMQSAARKIAGTHKRSANTIQSAYQRAAGMASSFFMRLAAVIGVGAIFRSLTSKMKEFVLQNEQAKLSINGLKAAFNGFAAGIVNLAMPAIMGFLRVVTTMVLTLARLVDSIFKTNFVETIRAQAASFGAASESGSKASKAMDKQAKSAKKLGKEVKEATKSIMAFDELNLLNGDKEDEYDGDPLEDIADELAGGADGGGFDGAALLEGIDATLAKIMLIAGAALLALGIILCVSGINIPLGLTLIAIGALMIYTAYAEQWDKLPADVQNALTTILLLMAGFLVVIGIILCLTGHVPLGIGLIVAGAAIFGVTAAMNPEYISGMVSSMLEHILGLIAGALIVIGVILCVVGHPLFGIAFIIAGAILFVGEAVLSWDSLTPQVQQFLIGLMSIIAGALIVLGVLLCAVGHPVLGIAAIIVGIVIFVVASTLDEEETPNKIRKFLTDMIPIIGKALVVVGVLLCIVGNLPLGIAAIIFGIIIWVTGEALTEGVPSGKIMSFLQEMLPVIGKALVVIGVLLCVFGQLPLGIAAIIFGVVIWVTGEVLNETLTKEKIEWFMNEILPILSTFMIVIGVILLATGVGIPIGIGLIIAGIGLLVFSAVNIDWGFLLNKIKGIWQDITNWFNSNVSQIFTRQFWEDKFKCIANGLISMINSGLSAFGDFINNLAGGLSNILTFFGVEGFSFSIGMPQIPYLATGAVIPPNRKFMAVLGDQTHGNNLEAPEGLIRQIVREETGRMADSIAIAISDLNTGNKSGDVNLVLRVGSEELARASAKGAASLARRGELRTDIAFV